MSPTSPAKKIVGKGNRGHLRPLNRQGQYLDGYKGSHRGPAESLNVTPTPGFRHFWCRHPKSDRGGAQLQRMLNSGWEVDPSGNGASRPENVQLAYSKLGLDEYQVHGDLILLRIPEEKYRAHKEHLEALNSAAQSDAVDTYLNGPNAQKLKAMYQDRAGGDIYYQGSDHGDLTTS